ncbi:MAG: DUF3047 domain-containing protein, partial [Pseudomonadota bacterium]
MKFFRLGRKPRLGAVLALCLAVLGGVSLADARLWIARFSASDIEGWLPYAYSGKTAYSLAESGDGIALKAESDAAASAYYRDQYVDLSKTPVLHWRWRVDHGPSGLQEQTRAGDDYAARVYVVHKRGLLRKPYIINYVWSGSQARGSEWANAWLPKHSAMLAVRGAQD